MIYTQTNNENIPYEQDVTGDTVASAVWTITPSATLSGQAVTASSATVFVAGLTVGTTYTLDVKITMTSGAIHERCATIVGKSC